MRAFPRTPGFKEDIIQAFYDGIKHKPETTFGNVKADVIADKEPHFHRGNFCLVIRNSAWRSSSIILDAHDQDRRRAAAVLRMAAVGIEAAVVD